MSVQIDGFAKPFQVFLILLMILPFSQSSYGTVPRPITVLNKRSKDWHSYQGNANIFATLGVVCKCCDGLGAECKSTFEGTCVKLQCHPWKFP